ncbi:hypothetical protein [Pseudoduganella sp. GCM10020061]|uniref:hypothetical protein n=1 Tax=Pseudoduganella sp. GCM10020061 TaxID=3317345 RepID=UPI003642F10B
MARAPRAAPKAAPTKSSKAAPARKAVAAKAVPARRKKPAATLVRETHDRASLVRDSFTMPEAEYALLAQAKQACLKAGIDVKKSELLRIAVAQLGRMDGAALKKALAKLPIIKTGRPRAE